MVIAQSNCYHTQYFSPEHITKEKKTTVFGSEKVKSIIESSSTDKVTHYTKDNFKTQYLNQSINDFDNIVDDLNNIEKPNFRKLCFIVALKLGFNLNSKGTLFIIDAILYLYSNNIDECKLEFIYNFLSQKYALTPKTIKWNMDNALKSMRRYTHQQDWYSFFYEYDGRILNTKYVIILFVYELRRKYTPTCYDSKEKIDKILYSI